MIGRLWRTGLQPGRGEAYERFAREPILAAARRKAKAGCPDTRRGFGSSARRKVRNYTP